MVSNKQRFKYNKSFYYQSTIIYFVVFALYLVIRGEFIEGSYTLITKDPILYFFAIIVIISIGALVFNIYKNKHLEIGDSNLCFITRTRKKCYRKDDIVKIKIFRERSVPSKRSFRFVSIKFRTRKRHLILKPSDYENSEELLKIFRQIKMEIEK